MRILTILVAFLIFVCHNGIDFYVEEETKASKSTSQICLVADQERLETERYCYSSLGAENSTRTSFKGSNPWTFDSSPFERNNVGKYEAECRMALHMVQNYERKTCELLSPMRRALARCGRGCKRLLQSLGQPAEGRQPVLSAMAQISEVQISETQRERQAERPRKESKAQAEDTQRRAGIRTTSTGRGCSSNSSPWSLLDASSPNNTSTSSDGASKCTRATCGADPAEYKALIDTLKKNQSKGTLPDDVQQELRTLKVKEEKDQNKELNQAVKGLRKARKGLQEAFEARSQLHTQWRNFLSLSVTQWQGFTSQFQAQEKVAMTRVAEAQQTLQEAKAQLASSKEIVDLATAQQMDGSNEVDLVSEEDAAKAVDSAQQMQSGMQNLTVTLEQLHQAAETIHANEQAAKKARLDGQEDVSGLPGSGQLQPFAQPGTKRPQSAGA